MSPPQKKRRMKKPSLNGTHRKIARKRKRQIVNRTKLTPSLLRDYGEILRSKSSHQKNGNSELYRKSLTLQLYEVSFEFGPLQLDRHDVVYKNLRKICQRIGEFPLGLEKSEYVFHIYLPKSSDIKQVCLDVFKSEPTTRPLKVGVDMSKHAISIVHIDIKSSNNKKFLCSVRSILEHNAQNPFVYVLCSPLNGHSESIMKTGIRAKNIIDARDISPIYEKCYELLGEKTEDLLSKLKKMHRKTPSLAKELIKIIGDLQTKLEKRNKNTHIQLPEPCTDILQTSCSSRKGIIGYMKSTDAITLLVNEAHKNHKTICTLKLRLLEKQPNLVIHELPFRPQIQIRPGERLYRTEKIGPYGTLGIYGSWQGKDVAITGAHVISANSPAYILKDDKFVKVGECIWSSPGEDRKVDIFNISVLQIYDTPQGLLEVCEGDDEFDIYDKTLSSLHNRKVFKIGGETGKTIGRIKEVDLEFEEGEDAVLVIPEPDNQEDIFSLDGDSGSIVFTKFGTSLYALGVVFGGHVNLFEKDAPESTTLVVNFKNALQKFKQSRGDLTLKKI